MDYCTSSLLFLVINCYVCCWNIPLKYLHVSPSLEHPTQRTIWLLYEDPLLPNTHRLLGLCNERVHHDEMSYSSSFFQPIQKCQIGWLMHCIWGTYLSDDPSNKDASLEKMAFTGSEQYSILNPPASNTASTENFTRKVPHGSNFGLLKVMMLSSQRLSLSTFIRLTSSSDAYLRRCDTRASLKLNVHGTNNEKKENNRRNTN